MELFSPLKPPSSCHEICRHSRKLPSGNLMTWWHGTGLDDDDLINVAAELGKAMNCCNASVMKPSISKPVTWASETTKSVRETYSGIPESSLFLGSLAESAKRGAVIMLTDCWVCRRSQKWTSRRYFCFLCIGHGDFQFNKRADRSFSLPSPTTQDTR